MQELICIITPPTNALWALHTIPGTGTTEPTLFAKNSDSWVVSSVLQVGCCNMKLFTCQRLVAERNRESAIDMLMGAWSDHDMLWIADDWIFWRSHLSVRKRSIREYNLCSTTHQKHLGQVGFFFRGDSWCLAIGNKSRSLSWSHHILANGLVELIWQSVWFSWGSAFGGRWASKCSPAYKKYFFNGAHQHDIMTVWVKDRSVCLESNHVFYSNHDSLFFGEEGHLEHMWEVLVGASGCSRGWKVCLQKKVSDPWRGDWAHLSWVIIC